MLAEQFTEAAAVARNSAALDLVARQLWAAHGEGHLADADASAISEAVQARRAALARQGAVSLSKPASARRRPSPRSPDRQASLGRRRRQTASGALPPTLACHFTLGEQAVLSVIAWFCMRHGTCRLPVDAIAALAGVSRRLVQQAQQAAARRWRRRSPICLVGALRRQPCCRHLQPALVDLFIFRAPLQSSGRRSRPAPRACWPDPQKLPWRRRARAGARGPRPRKGSCPSCHSSSCASPQPGCFLRSAATGFGGGEPSHCTAARR